MRMNLFTRLSCKFLLAVFFSALWVQVSAQSKVVTGTVSDISGNPVIGAKVVVKSAAFPNTAVTGADGSFSLDNVPRNAVLSVSFLGYVTEEYTLRNEDKHILFVMREAQEVLDDVVVVGFGTQKKASVVGAISTVQPKELVSPARSLTNTLAGRVSGIIAVQRSGEPGKDDATFWIRGMSTFTGNQDPLILVDGIERSMSNVDPLEIESFSVLKDASATAVYGVRGANGVVLITTKRGFDGPAKIDARYEQGISWATFRPSYLDAVQRSTLFNEAVYNSFSPDVALGHIYTDDEIMAMRIQSDPELYPNVDWQSVLMRPITLNEKVHVNISGGGKMVRYYTAVSFLNQQGQYYVNPGKYYWVPTEISSLGRNVNYMRYSFRSNVDMDLSNTTTVSLGLQGNVNINNTPPNGSGEIYTWMNNSAPNAFPIIYKDGNLPGRDGIYNPYVLLTQKGYAQVNTQELRANLTVEQNLKAITQGLRLTVRYAYDAIAEVTAKRERSVTRYEAIERLADGSLSYKETDVQEDNLNYSSSEAGNRNQYLEASFNYDRQFGKHEVGALALYYMKDYRDDVVGDYISSLPYRSQGLAGRITYAYDNRYLLEVNLGWNGSENFPKGLRMGLFPAIAGGWIVSNESFLENNETLSFLKLRASWGQVGNDQIRTSTGSTRRFAWLSILENGDGYSGFGEKFDQSGGGLKEQYIGTSNITWEVATKYDLGVELEFLHKFKLNADVFYEKRKNIFLQPQASTLAGLQIEPSANLGEMDNRGFEVTAEYSNRWDKFTFSVRGNYTFARNKILKTYKEPDYPWSDQVGKRYGERLVFDAMHLFSQEEIDALPDYYRQFTQTKESLKPGDIRYRDVNDDGIISEADKVYLMSPSVPEHVFGFGASMEYKGFDFSFLFQGALGATTSLNAGWYFFPFQAERDPKYMGNVIEPFLDRWVDKDPGNPDAFSNENQYAFAPRMQYKGDGNNYVSSTWWLRKVSYIRLKNLELGYTLPESVSRKIKMERMRIYVMGQNLWTGSSFIKKFWDPEVGLEAYPIQATVFIGLNITL